MNKETIPNFSCYQCRWRGHLAEDTHSKCYHPYNREVTLLASTKRASVCIPDKRLKIKVNKRGLEQGWRNYPFHFDPIEVKSCKGFETITSKDIRAINKFRAADIHEEAQTCEKPYFCEECPERYKCFTGE